MLPAGEGTTKGTIIRTVIGVNFCRITAENIVLNLYPSPSTETNSGTAKLETGNKVRYGGLTRAIAWVLQSGWCEPAGRTIKTAAVEL